jgi:hypothetical protein
MYMSESNDPYKYAVTTSINYKDRCFYIVRDIRYQKVIPFITGEYVSLKSTPSLYVKSCTTSLALYLTTSLFSFLFRMKTHLNPISLFSFLFQMKTHLNPIGNVLQGVGITSVNTFPFLIELSSSSIVSFHLFSPSVSYTLPWS